MSIIVQKFGGTSVENTEMLRKVKEHIIREKNKGNNVVVVVSAQGKMTNRLIDEEKEITQNPNKREHDVLVSVGEQITISKLAMVLQEDGYNAISFTGWQVPIKTDDIHTNANIIEINTKKILEKLDEGNIVIIAGFQGVNEKGEITTLGRGGSDTTAVHIAASLNAEVCEIYTDVDGVYEKDPKENKNAKKFKTITYDKMLEMANNGAKVLHNKCVETAKKYNVKIDVKSTWKDGETGTIVTKND